MTSAVFLLLPLILAEAIGIWQYFYPSEKSQSERQRATLFVTTTSLVLLAAIAAFFLGSKWRQLFSEAEIHGEDAS